MTPEIALTPIEQHIACLVGYSRHVWALRRGLKDRNGTVQPDTAWGNHIEGAAAELAFAKALGWYWAADVGLASGVADVRHVNVRSTRHANGQLLIKAGDHAGVYVLVTGLFPVYRVRGWVEWPEARDVAELRELATGRPAYCIAQARLSPLETLPLSSVEAAP